jgi:FkbM family methyltransferase
MRAERPPLPFSEDDIFRGFAEDDVERVRALMVAADPVPGLFTDQLGVKVDPAYCSWVAHNAGLVAAGLLPLPRDGYLAEGIEYAALAWALEWAQGRASFVVGEIGAGWGPWVSAATLVALRRGFRGAHLVALEADAARYQQLRRHLSINGLVPEDAPERGGQDTLSWTLLRAAASPQDGTLYWPEGDPEDAGMSASTSPCGVDYRGQTSVHRPVVGLSLATCFLDAPADVDFLHIDIQGGEAELIPGSLPFLNERVRSMFVGTHSRKIEGDLIELLRCEGWALEREKPCRFNNYSAAPTLVGLTHLDGGQFWRNPRLC